MNRIFVKERSANSIVTKQGTFGPGDEVVGLSGKDLTRVKHLVSIKEHVDIEKKPKLQEVVAAISKLSPDNDDHWTTSGKPQTGALSEVVGKAVNAELRDKAFAVWKDKQEASTAEVEVAES